MSPGSLARPSGLRGIDDCLLLRPVSCGSGEPQNPEISGCACAAMLGTMSTTIRRADDVILRSIPGTFDRLGQRR